MKHMIFVALSLLLLTSCKYHGTWNVKEPLTLKSKSKDILIQAGKQNGLVGVSKNKISLTFKAKPQTKLEIKVPKGKITGNEGPFEVAGTEVGQIYDFTGFTHSTTNETETECEHQCEDSNGNLTSCFPPKYYSCTVVETTAYITLNIVEPSTKTVKATFSGSIYNNYIEQEDSGYNGGFPWHDGGQWP